VRSTGRYNSGGQFDCLSFSAVLKLAAGDAVAVQAYQNRGGAELLVATADPNFLNIKQIA
jgi:hypothetical protein